MKQVAIYLVVLLFAAPGYAQVHHHPLKHRSQQMHIQQTHVHEQQAKRIKNELKKDKNIRLKAYI